MFKKICMIFMLCVCLGIMPAWSSQVRETIISTTQLDDSPTSVTGTTNAGSADKIAFFVTYDETEVGNSISLAITMQISYDGTTWLSASFYDYAGGSTLQTSETLTSDGSYYCWFNPDLAIPQVKLILTATNTDADDIASVVAYCVKNQ